MKHKASQVAATFFMTGFNRDKGGGSAAEIYSILSEGVFVNYSSGSASSNISLPAVFWMSSNTLTFYILVADQICILLVFWAPSIKI